MFKDFFHCIGDFCYAINRLCNKYPGSVTIGDSPTFQMIINTFRRQQMLQYGSWSSSLIQAYFVFIFQNLGKAVSERCYFWIFVDKFEYFTQCFNRMSRNGTSHSKEQCKYDHSFSVFYKFYRPRVNWLFGTWSQWIRVHQWRREVF